MSRPTHHLPIASPLARSAPGYLTERQATIWLALFESRPDGYFSQSDEPMLAALAVATSEHRRLAAELEEEYDIGILGRASRLMDMHAARIASIATRLRLTPQSRYTPERSAVAARGALPPEVVTLANYRNGARA